MTQPLPLHSQRRFIQRLNKTFGTQSKLTFSPSMEKSKGSIVKKILMQKVFKDRISSIKQQVKKILLKYIENGGKGLGIENVKKIVDQCKSILDNDKQKQLQQDLTNLEEQTENNTSLLKIIKTLVISPLQKSYIVKIQKELAEDQQLDSEIRDIEEQIGEQKLSKLRLYESQKSGVSSSQNINLKNSWKQVQNYENKLMRANQKLNELSSNNNKLRQRINQLRKEKNAMEDIYGRLKKELQSKKENVQNTIKYAGEAYNCRNKAEEDLKNLKDQAEVKKQQFKQECEKLNSEIQHDIRFKQFIKSKEVQKEQLQRMEQKIRENQQNIELRKEENHRIDNEFQKSLLKEMQIKQAFDKIKQEIGLSDLKHENEGRELLNVFIDLYEKNSIMKRFVEEMIAQIENIEQKIEQRKKEIQMMYLKGSADECEKEKLNQDLKKRFQYQERKKSILDSQYQKSVATLGVIKKHLEDIFDEIEIDPNVTEKLKNSNLNQESLTQYLGQLQKKGLEAISQYGKLVSEQLRAEKGSNWEMQKQIDELNNIITLENVNSMNNCSAGGKINEYPSELIIKVKEDRVRQQELEKALSMQELKKFAIQSLEQYQRKQQPKQKHLNKKYNIAPMISKSKKK